MAGTQKTVVVLPGPTGPTGTIKGVNILGAFTGATGRLPQWLQATGPSGPSGTLEKVYNIGPTGLTGGHKTVIILGYAATGAAAGSGWSLTDNLNVTISDANNQTMTTTTGNGNGRSASNHTTGKFYFEAVTEFISSSGAIGFDNLTDALSGGPLLGGITWNGSFFQEGSSQDPGWGSPDGRRIGIAVDLGTANIWVTYDGVTWNNGLIANQNPATGVGGTRAFASAWPLGVAMAIIAGEQNAGHSVQILTGLSQFAYALPAGFAAWG